VKQFISKWKHKTFLLALGPMLPTKEFSPYFMELNNPASKNYK
jgi:hypothetical protein